MRLLVPTLFTIGALVFGSLPAAADQQSDLVALDNVAMTIWGIGAQEVDVLDTPHQQCQAPDPDAVQNLSNQLTDAEAQADSIAQNATDNMAYGEAVDVARQARAANVMLIAKARDYTAHPSTALQCPHVPS